MNPLLILAALVAGASFLKKKGPATPGLPPTVDQLKALGEKVAADIGSKGVNYDRELLKSFQAAAAIRVDGLYGPESAAALTATTGQVVPAPVFIPKETTEPPSRVTLSPLDQGEAKRIAERVFEDLTQHASNYDRELLKSFQRAVHALWVDGKYGPATAGALQYFTDRIPPRPIYTNASGSREIVPYKLP